MGSSLTLRWAYQPLTWLGTSVWQSWYQSVWGWLWWKVYELDDENDSNSDCDNHDDDGGYDEDDEYDDNDDDEYEYDYVINNEDDDGDLVLSSDQGGQGGEAPLDPIVTFLKAAQATSAENEDDGYSDVGDGDNDDGGDYNDELEGKDRYAGHFLVPAGKTNILFTDSALWDASVIESRCPSVCLCVCAIGCRFF